MHALPAVIEVCKEKGLNSGMGTETARNVACYKGYCW